MAALSAVTATNTGTLDPPAAVAASDTIAQTALGPHGAVLSIINAKFELATVLLAAGANPNDDRAGWTALHQVAWTRRPNVGHNNPEPVHTDDVDSLDLVKQLLARGADPNARVKKEPRTGLNSFNRIGATPFLLAAKDVDIPYLQLLLAHVPIRGLTNVDGTTALMSGGRRRDVRSWGGPPARSRIARDGEAAGCDGLSRPPPSTGGARPHLHGAAFRGANDVVRYLVDHGADLAWVNDKGGRRCVAEGIFINATLKSQPKTAALIRELMAERAATFSLAAGPTLAANRSRCLASDDSPRLGRRRSHRGGPHPRRDPDADTFAPDLLSSLRCGPQALACFSVACAGGNENRILVTSR
jgi:hypothetical protein